MIYLDFDKLTTEFSQFAKADTPLNRVYPFAEGRTESELVELEKFEEQFVYADVANDKSSYEELLHAVKMFGKLCIKDEIKELPYNSRDKFMRLKSSFVSRRIY